MKKTKGWFYSYVWEPEPGRQKFEMCFSQRHPFEVVREWGEKFDGNNGSVLLWFTEAEITDDQAEYLEIE